MYLEIDNFSIGERIAEMIVPAVRERRALLEREANTDALTGLASRAAFDKGRASAEADADISFIAFDCNNFGMVNKLFGHASGDKILTTIASEINRASVANRARAFRFGGDEFVVLASVSRAEYVRDAIERRVGEFAFSGFTVSVSGEIGATFKDADAKLQARKAQRKEQI